jgi:hypothetical protein
MADEFERYCIDVLGEHPDKYLPEEPVKLTQRQKDLILMRLTYHHFANKKGFWVEDAELQKVLNELEF